MIPASIPNVNNPKHPQLVLAVTVIHVLLVCNRIATMGTTTNSPSAFLYQVASYLSIAALVFSAVTFALLAIEFTRRKIAKLVFVACIALILIADVFALVCYLIYNAADGVSQNRKQLAILSAIVTGISIIVCGILIPLLLFCGPADLKSHRSMRSAEQPMRPMMPPTAQPVRR